MSEGQSDVLPGGSAVVASGAAVRLAAEASWALLALLAGAIVGQQLGPDGKGTVATITYLVALVVPLVAFGLGEAGIELIRRGQVALPTATSTGVAFVGVASVGGVLVLVLLARAALGPLVPELDGTMLAASLAIPLFAAWQVLSVLLDATGGVVHTSIAKLVSGMVTAAATVELVLLHNCGVAGAVAAASLGFGAGAAVVALALARRGGSFHPSWNATYLRAALRVGRPVSASYLMMALSARADLLLVGVIRSPTQAGLYSVALTFGQLVSYPAIALSAASYGAAARMGDDEAAAYITRLAQAALALAAAAALVFAPIVPILLPRAFGSGFRDAVPTTIILLPAGVLYSMQWVLARAWAARGKGHLLATSYGVTLGVMITVDGVLVPLAGQHGAAVGSVIAAVAGWAVCWRTHVRWSPVRPMLRDLVPRPSTVTRLAASLRAARGPI